MMNANNFQEQIRSIDYEIAGNSFFALGASLFIYILEDRRSKLIAKNNGAYNDSLYNDTAYLVEIATALFAIGSFIFLYNSYLDWKITWEKYEKTGKETSLVADTNSLVAAFLQFNGNLINAYNVFALKAGVADVEE